MDEDDSVSMMATAQKHEIAELLNSTLLAKDDAWYVIDFEWMKRWKKFVGYDHWDTEVVGNMNAHPGPINNAHLLEDNLLTLRPDLTEENDFTLVPEKVWKKLVDFYALPMDQQPVKRYVIECGIISKRFKVDVYQLELSLCRDFNENEAVRRSFSTTSTLESVVVSMRNIFCISQHKNIQLWLKNMSSCYDRVYKWTDTLQDASLCPGQLVIIQVPDNNGQYIMPERTSRSVKKNSAAGSVCTGAPVNTPLPNSPLRLETCYHTSRGNGIVQNNTYGAPQNNKPGLCGLGNLGNTCFMNAALQCLSNVPSLTEYMLSDRWRAELNKVNVLGHNGKIAEAYADLIGTIWSGRQSYIFPRDFKSTIGKYKPDFSGFLPQDAHELLAFLLDGLHEDLNRIKVKPTTVEKAADNRPDKEVATEAWVDYIRRNDSVIIDNFHGLLKSTLVCLACEQVSVKFDPFAYLSLPLPVKGKERQVKISVVRYDPMCPLRRFRVNVSPGGFIADLCLGVSRLTDVVAENMIVVTIHNHQFRRFFKPEDCIPAIDDYNDLFVYEVPDSKNGALINIPIEMNEAKSADRALTISKVVYERKIPKSLKFRYKGIVDRMPASEMRSSPTKLFGLPMIVSVPKDNCTYERLYNTVLNQTIRYVGFKDSASGSWTPFQDIGVDATDKEDMDVDEDDDDDEDDDEDGDDQTSNNNSKSESDEAMEGTCFVDVNDSSPCTESEQLFTFQTVTSYQRYELGQIKDDGGPIQFSESSGYVANWDPEMKFVFYHESRALLWDNDAPVYNTKLTETPTQVNLSDCLDHFTSRERLGETGQGIARRPGVKDSGEWLCPACKKPQKATKKIDIWQLPPVLVIHLKRFSFSRNLRHKLDTFVRFPVGELNMQKWIINSEHEPAVYDLLAVTNHMGGMGFGHYTAYAKNKDDEKWHRFDDSNVKLVTKGEVVSKDGYILVYQRRSETPSLPASTWIGSKSVTTSPPAAKDDQN